MFNRFKVIIEQPDDEFSPKWYIVKKRAWWMPFWLHVGIAHNFNDAVAMCNFPLPNIRS